MLFYRDLEDEVEKECFDIDSEIKNELVTEWEKIDDGTVNERLQVLKDNHEEMLTETGRNNDTANFMKPSEEYVHEFKYIESDAKKKSKRGKAVRKLNEHIDIDFMLNFTDD